MMFSYIMQWSTAEVSALSHILNGLSIAADSLLKVLK